MSYSKTFMHNVLADILNQQDIPNSDADIAPERIREALTTGPGFNAAEAKLLWASPLVREEYREIRNHVQADARARCQHLTLTIAAVSAAFAPAQNHHLRAPDDSFQVDLLHTGDPEEPWVVQLLLSDALQTALGDWHQLHLRLVDSGGAEWLCQQYQGEDVLIQNWKNATQGPDERMRAFAIQLLIE